MLELVEVPVKWLKQQPVLGKCSTGLALALEDFGDKHIISDSLTLLLTALQWKSALSCLINQGSFFLVSVFAYSFSYCVLMPA